MVVHFKDDATAGNGEKKVVIDGKGVLNQRISEYLFTKINEMGLPTHFPRSLNMREQLVREVEIIPLGSGGAQHRRRVHFQAVGHRRGQTLPRSIIEFYYKNDQLGDPMVTEEHVTAFGWASPQEMDDIVHMSISHQRLLERLVPRHRHSSGGLQTGVRPLL